MQSLYSGTHYNFWMFWCLSSELDILIVRKQGINISSGLLCPSSSVVVNSQHVLACQPWLHWSECTCLTTTTRQCLQSLLCCTIVKQPWSNDQLAADDLDHARVILHLICTSCYTHSVTEQGLSDIQFNDKARDCTFSSAAYIPPTCKCASSANTQVDIHQSEFTTIGTKLSF